MQSLVRLQQALAAIPGKVTNQWPQGERFAQVLRNERMSVELYAPVGDDPQQPHLHDELYVIVSGSGIFDLNGQKMSFAAHDVIFVPAMTPHKFETMTEDFKTWVIFILTKI